MKGAGLHPSVFFFIVTIMFHLCVLDPPLTFDKMAKKLSFRTSTTGHFPFLPPKLFPVTFPAMTKRGPLLYRHPFLIEEPQCWTSSAT